MPEPKAVIKAAFRAEVARLGAEACPVLRLERGKAAPTFRDVHADFGLSPSYAAGLMAWLFPDAMIDRLEAMVEREIDDAAAMGADEQEKELARLGDEIEALQRSEENLIEAAFGRGVDVLRRAGADPACVLGVRARIAVPVPRPQRVRMRPASPGDPSFAAAAGQPAEAAE